MSRRLSNHVPLLCAVLGVLLAVLGSGLVASRRSSDRGRLDHALDATAGENAVVVRGRRTSRLKLADVRGWPSFREGVSTPIGKVRISTPFVSPAARVPVIAGTTGVAVNGHLRAYVELELAVSALRQVLSSDVPRGVSVEMAARNGTPLLALGSQFDPAVVSALVDVLEAGAPAVTTADAA